MAEIPIAHSTAGKNGAFVRVDEYDEWEEEWEAYECNQPTGEEIQRMLDGLRRDSYDRTPEDKREEFLGKAFFRILDQRDERVKSGKMSKEDADKFYSDARCHYLSREQYGLPCGCRVWKNFRWVIPVRTWHECLACGDAIFQKVEQ